MNTPTSQGQDAKDLERFGYRQELERSMGGFSSFAAGFSYISILTGVFQMFHLGYGMAGPAFFWTWPVVLGGQFLVALCFADLAAQYPLSGGVYQWAKFTGTRFTGWMTGWIYLACLVTTIAAVALALQVSLPQIAASFQFIGDHTNPTDAAVNAILLGTILIAASTLINARGIRLLAILNNIGVFAELAGIVLLLGLLLYHSVRSPAEAVALSATTPGSAGLQSLVAAAALTASYVLFGFDTAGSLAEETIDPRRRAPRAILQALLAAGLSGLLVLLFALMAAPESASGFLGQASGGLPLLVRTVLGDGPGRIFLIVVIFAIIVCTLAVHSGTVRLMYAMGRDNLLPFSGWLSAVSTKRHTPVNATLVAGIAAILILLVNLKFPRVVELVSSIAILWANLGYLIVVSVQLRNRISGKQDTQHQFLGARMGMIINVLAVCWSLFMVVNVGWPRTSTYGEAWYNQWAALIYTAILAIAGILIYFYRHNQQAHPHSK
ncbi:MAG: amino acid permease [Bacteroidota bacterium]